MPIQLTTEVLTVALGGSGLLGVVATKAFDYLTGRDKGKQSEFTQLIDMLQKQGDATGTNLGVLINHILSEVTTTALALGDVRAGLLECRSAHARCEEDNENRKNEIDQLRKSVLELKGN